MSITPSIAVDTVKKTPINISNGKTLYVGGTGEGNYTKIQDAIDNASDGVTVFVFDESSPYEEKIIVDKSINLIGENRDTTIIYEYYYSDYALIYINADRVNLTGFTIIKNSYFTHLLINSSYNKISNNNFTRCYDSGYSGIEIFNKKNYNIISDNIFYKCGVLGIYIHDRCTNSKIINNTFLNNLHDLDVQNRSHNTTIIGNKFLNTECCCVIDIKSSNNNIIKDNLIAPYYREGIELYDSHYNTIQNNTIIGNNHYKCDGIELLHSNHNYIFNNYLTISGLTLWNSSQNNVKDNIVNNKHLVYLENISDCIIPTNTGQVILISCNNITIKNQDLSDTTDGILLWETTNCTIFNCLISENYRGIQAYKSNQNIITYNRISNNGYGIQFLSSSNNNMIYLNDFFKGYRSAEDKCTNLWNNSNPYVGNFWDDYTGNDSDGDGIGDTPYLIPGGNNKDWFPLMKPYGNQPPDAPDIDGPTSGKVGVEYEYNFSLSDPDGDSMWIHIDWEHGIPGKWDGPFLSGSIIKYNYTWRKKGTYTIRAQTQDSSGLLSDWGTLTVTIPRNRAFNFNLFEWFFDRFPLLEVFLRAMNLLR